MTNLLTRQFATLKNIYYSGINPHIYDVGVIGGGIVGLAVARECAVRGYSVVLLEKEETVAAGASSGNSGLGCTGYDAPFGSLEQILLRRSIRLRPALYRSFGLHADHVRNSGSLIVAWNQEQLQQLLSISEENKRAGDTDIRHLNMEELRAVEVAHYFYTWCIIANMFLF